MKTAGVTLMLSVLVAGFALAAPPPKSAIPERRIAIRVTSRGFEPAVIRVRSGRPLVLVVTRTTERTCAKEIVIAERKIRQPLPLNRAVEVRLTPEKPGSLRFACGMDMISGRLVVE